MEEKGGMEQTWEKKLGWGCGIALQVMGPCKEHNLFHWTLCCTMAPKLKDCPDLDGPSWKLKPSGSFMLRVIRCQGHIVGKA